LFDHVSIRQYDFLDIPLNEDTFLMDEKWLAEYEKNLVKMCYGGDYANVGYISHVAVRSITPTFIELSWYPNVFDRIHEVSITLPRTEFIICVDCPSYDEKLHIFAKSEWLSNLHLRSYSVFAMVDAIGVKNALANGDLTRKKLITLRNNIDELAKDYPTISFVSFADSLLIKSNWFVGQYDSHIKYTYEPEMFISLIYQLRSIYRDVLKMEIYAVLTQGSNEYYDDALLHISSTKNHISLNSLGVPFAQLMSIDTAARSAINNNVHNRAELYMDESFYHSLQFKYEFDKKALPSNAYQFAMSSSDNYYFHSDHETIMDNLERSKD